MVLHIHSMQGEFMLNNEFEYYLNNQSDLVKKYNGKIIVIIDNQVIGSYANEMDAIRETSKTHAMGTFLVQKCEPGKESYTQTFHSRVAIV